MSGVSDGAAGWDFFISYAEADRQWAEWIAWQLEKMAELDYRVLIKAWDSVPGSDWVFRMNEGISKATRTIAVLSNAYLSSEYGGEEWRAARTADPSGLKRKLLPIRVEDCEPPGLLRTLRFVDLFGLAPDTAQQRLLDEVRGALVGRMKPDVEPEYPVQPRQTTPASPAPFPDRGAAAVTSTSGATSPMGIEAHVQITDEHPATPLLNEPGSLVSVPDPQARLDSQVRPTVDGRRLTFRSVAPALGAIVATVVLAGGAVTSSVWWAARPGEVLGPVGVGTAMAMLTFASASTPRRPAVHLAVPAVASACLVVIVTRAFGLHPGALRTGLEAAVALVISLVIRYLPRPGARYRQYRRRLGNRMDGQPSRPN